MPPKRAPTTVNNIITTVTNFYDYLYRNDELNNDLVEKKIMRQIHGGGRKYKDFLYHINKDKPVNNNILKIKKPRKKQVNRLTKEQVEILYNACSNIRDKFLIKLLFETGLRISEALALYIEDIVFDPVESHKVVLKERGELPNGGS